jgi:anti-sigma factor RsiW
MSVRPDSHDQSVTEQVSLYALQALPADELPVVETHLSTCVDCQRHLQALRPVVDAFVGWPTDVLRPPASLWDRLAQRIAEDTGQEPVRVPVRTELRRSSGSRWRRG